MDTVGNQFDGHAISQIDTLHRTLILVLTALVESGHGVVEVGSMGESSFEGLLDAIIFSLRV